MNTSHWFLALLACLSLACSGCISVKILPMGSEDDDAGAQEENKSIWNW